MIQAVQIEGRDDPTLVARAEQREQRRAALAKRPTKPINKLTPKERDAAIDAMLEWWLVQEKE